jgi:RNA polymerase sigma-70 factor, ECF subfamily
MARILYVEDEEDYQLLVRRIVGKAGHEIVLAGSAAEGHAQLNGLPPDLIILDVNLPDADGYALCADWRQSGISQDTPVLMLTVRRRPEEWLKGFAAGADDYLSKPFNPADLLDRVARALSDSGITNRAFRQQSAEYLQIQASVRGNRAAFDTLVSRYRGRLEQSMRNNGRTKEEAEDFAAAAFARAYERLAEFHGKSSFYTWLYRIAFNEADHERKHRNHASWDAVAESEEAPEIKGLTQPDYLSEQTVEEFQKIRVHQALRDIPRPFQQVIRWYFIKGLSYQRISRRLGIPTGTVMSRLFKAKDLLRQSWDRQPASPADRLLTRRSRSR